MNDYFYKGIVDNAQIAYAYHKIIYSEDGIPCDYEFLEVNRSFEKMTGLKRADIIGKAVSVVLPEIKNDKFDWIKFFGRVAINGGNEEFEQFSEALNGWKKGRVYSPQKEYFITLFEDASEQKQLEVDWKIESERYHAFLESTDDWVWIAEPEHFRLMVFNSAVAKYFKETENVILKNDMTLEEIISGKTVEEVKEFYKKAKSDGKLGVDYCANEGKLHMKLTLSRLDVDERTVGIAVVGKNVTKEIQYKDELEESNKTLSLMLWQSINTISKIGEMRDVYTAGHQKRVAELSCAIAKEMGLSEEEINNISLAALIHDIGKIYIASDILNKQGKITNLEYQILQTHAEQSYKVLDDIDFPGQIKTMIYQHHERMDGSGYPQKLVGNQIILEGRILAVADVVEAMSSHRPYRPALGIEAALEEIQTYRGIRYDAEVVEVCVKLFQDYKFNFNEEQN